jgi:hypothetical protein
MIVPKSNFIITSVIAFPLTTTTVEAATTTATTAPSSTPSDPASSDTTDTTTSGSTSDEITGTQYKPSRGGRPGKKAAAKLQSGMANTAWKLAAEEKREARHKERNANFKMLADLHKECAAQKKRSEAVYLVATSAMFAQGKNDENAADKFGKKLYEMAERALSSLNPSTASSTVAELNSDDDSSDGN